MKSDTERKKYYTEKLHKRKNRLHVHLSKDLKGKMKVKTRAISVRKGDSVRIMRGPEKGKEVKVSDVNVLRRLVFLEGIVVKNSRGREVPVPIEPSNLLLLSLESTPERKELFSDDAFKKKEKPKETPKVEVPKVEKTDGSETKHEHKSAAPEGHKSAEHRAHEQYKSASAAPKKVDHSK